MLGRLPLTLLSLLLATLEVVSEPTTSNDPFRAIVLRIPRQPEPPLCCLKAPQSLEPADDDVLLSFEDWKAKQSQMQAQAAEALSEATDKGNNGSGSMQANSSKGDAGSDLKEGSASPEDMGSVTQAGSEGPHSTEALLPHFRVPITDRFNYASLDCSARVHATHKGAKSSSSILSSKKDRYMLSPCQTPNVQQFVVVELCEDIRIDTVQMANFEFFSGVFKDFSVSVAKTYNGPWADAGTYRAKNIRGVQSFHTSSTLRDFYRYIRIDFHSHYGNEYYCPLSLLRVYGLTHLEEWKWELWEAESKAKRAELENVVKVAIPVSASELEASAVTSTLSTAQAPQPTTDPDTPVVDADSTITLQPIPSSIDLISANSTLAIANISTTDFPNDTPSESNDTHISTSSSHTQAYQTLVLTDSPSATLSPISVSTISGASSSSSSVASISTSSVSPPPNGTASDKFISTRISSNSTSSSPTTRAATISTPSQSTQAQSSLASVPVLPSPIVLPPSAGKGGESIYRTIMNRLSSIESTHNLYAQYIEQQNSAIRDLIKRLNEDIGRLEAVTRSQRATYQKTSQQWEKEKRQMVIDYSQLKSKVDHLSEEIVLEKRLGVVQLCLLLAVLIFVGLTRGSRGESIVVNSAPTSMREWGRRHLRLSGDWRFMRRSTSDSPVHAELAPPKSSSPSKTTAKLPENKLHFPRARDHDWKKVPLEDIQLNTAPLPSEYRASRQKKLSLPRPRTPSIRTAGISRTPQTAVPQRTGTPTPIRVSHLRPQFLQRSSSQGGHSSIFPGAAPVKSAKKWARSAHLHPAKPPSATPAARRSHPHTRTPSRDSLARHTDENTFLAAEMEPLDIFSTPAGASVFSQGMQSRSKRQLMSRTISGDDRESNWADTDSMAGSDVDVDDTSELDIVRMD